MAKRGGMRWCPRVVIDELEDIKREDGVNGDAIAFREMIKYARVGREANRIVKLNWSKKKKLPSVESYPLRGHRRKKLQWL